MTKWKEPTKRQKTEWEATMLLDIVDISTAIIRLADSIAISVCKITTLRDEMIGKLSGTGPEPGPAAIKAWREMASLKSHEEWPSYATPQGHTPKPPELPKRKRKRKTKKQLTPVKDRDLS